MKCSLSHILTSEGRVVCDDDGNFDYYEYNPKDHLGNTRVVFSEDDGVIKNNDYYPFGMLMGGTDAQPVDGDNKFLYNGKEYINNTDLNLSWYDYGARFYDPQLGRWHSVDGLAELHYNYTPYAYVYNSPLNYIDPFELEGEAVGADGLTNKQWVEASRPGADPNLARQYRIANRRKETENARANASLTDFLANSGLSGFYTAVDGQIQRIWVDGISRDAYYKASSSDDASSGGAESGGFFSDGVWTFGITGTASAGMIGGSAEIGITLDFRKGFKMGGYATLEHAVGADSSGGLILNYHKPVKNTNNFGISNLNGWGESYNGGLWIFDGTYGGNATNPGLNPNNYSDSHSTYNTYGFGVSVGTPFGFTRNKGYTWTTPTFGW